MELLSRNSVLISPGVYEIKPMFKTFVGLFGLDEEYYADRLFDLAESLYGSSPGEFGLDRFSKQIGMDTLIVHCEDDRAERDCDYSAW